MGCSLLVYQIELEDWLKRLYFEPLIRWSYLGSSSLGTSGRSYFNGAGNPSAANASKHSPLCFVSFLAIFFRLTIKDNSTRRRVPRTLSGIPLPRKVQHVGLFQSRLLETHRHLGAFGEHLDWVVNSDPETDFRTQWCNVKKIRVKITFYVNFYINLQTNFVSTPNATNVTEVKIRIMWRY